MLCCCSRDNSDDLARDAAAVKIQARQRGNKDRQLAASRQEELARYKAAAESNEPLVAEEIAEEGHGVSRIMQIDIVSAKGLRDVVGKVLRGKKSCPFVRAEVGSIKFQSQIIKSNLNPVWNESFEVVDYASGTPIELTVVHPAVKKTPEIILGKVTLECANFEAEGYEGDLKLNDTGLKKGDAFIKVKVTWTDQALVVKTGRISQFKEMPIEQWIVRYRAIGLRCGPGVNEKRANVDLRPGEEFGVVEMVEGADEQKYLRLADGRGWAFTKSPKDGEILAERVDNTPLVQVDEDDAAMDVPEAAKAEA